MDELVFLGEAIALARCLDGRGNFGTFTTSTARDLDRRLATTFLPALREVATANGISPSRSNLSLMLLMTLMDRHVGDDPMRAVGRAARNFITAKEADLLPDSRFHLNR